MNKMYNFNSVKIYLARKYYYVLKKTEKLRIRQAASARDTSSPELSIVILAWPPHYRDSRNYITLIESIKATTKISYEIILIFNSYTDEMLDSIAKLTGDSSPIRFAVLNQNIGVPRAWNVGAHMSEGNLLFFINEDVIVGKGCIDELTNTFTQNSNIGIAGPEGGFWDADRGVPLSFVELKSDINSCDAVSGFMFAIPKTILGEAGGFDNNYTPCFFEEVDIGFRVRELGYQCVAVKGLEYFHKAGASSLKQWKRIFYLGITEDMGTITNRNRSYFVDKWGRQRKGYLGNKEV
ncbi:MAG: glycosyltransferase [Candidatus Omnitrophota bacterium]|jgi:GT2 family glycosyltransferase|nr:MAG: glycosyltransferase [Candidatus Omnitrophota bacterium]